MERHGNITILSVSSLQSISQNEKMAVNDQVGNQFNTYKQLELIHLSFLSMDHPKVFAFTKYFGLHMEIGISISM